MFDKIKAWFDKNNVSGGNNGDSLRAFIENAFKAVVELLAKLGEWPIDFE